MLILIHTPLPLLRRHANTASNDTNAADVGPASTDSLAKDYRLVAVI
jgi:hypothetical protein